MLSAKKKQALPVNNESSYNHLSELLFSKDLSQTTNSSGLSAADNEYLVCLDASFDNESRVTEIVLIAE